MSVSLKSKEEMCIITGGLLYHLDLFRDALTESDTYQSAKGRVGEYSEGKGAGFEELFICWLMFRMWVANKVAYSIQYDDNVNLREDLPEVAPCPVDLTFLAAELRNLDYNIYTNGGQYWLDREWHDLFIIIMDCIKEASEFALVGGAA